MDLKKFIRGVKDFPIKGIYFYDITTLLKNSQAFHSAVDAMAAHYRGRKIDYIACIESRGFIFGAALAYKLKTGMVVIRKKGKLPAKKLSVRYKLEYGFDSIEVHEDAVIKNKNYLILDDLLATGGTSLAAYQLLKKKNAKVMGFAFLIELVELNGRKKLPAGPELFTMLKY
ncbi:adenine phosphoribosyltransferase [bacterium]|nr:adenine phosphoribosyltransferase [bacterium]MBU3956007.1 adenine phosphoribosyltransferase [bacterium]